MQFNIRNTSIGDDYAAMKEALERHFSRLKKSEIPLPDVCFIDGGLGQVNIALKVMEDLQIPTTQIIGVSKGKERKAGEETIILNSGKEKTKLEKNSQNVVFGWYFAVLHFIWLSKTIFFEPLIYLIILITLLTLRLDFIKFLFKKKSVT